MGRVCYVFFVFLFVFVFVDFLFDSHFNKSVIH